MGGLQPITLWLYGLGTLVVTLGGSVVSEPNSVLSKKLTKVSLGRVKEGTPI